MPTDLLLPAFVLTLLANAALVAMALRGLVRARAERNHPGPPSRRRRVDPAAPEHAETSGEPIVAAMRTSSNPPAPEPAAVVDAPPASEPARPTRRTRATTPKPPAPKPVDPTEPTKRKRPADRDRPRSDAPRGGRRRFSLPPLDDDHERVNRSIETFLSGSEGGDGPVDIGPGAPTGATTVAIVAIDGLDPDGTDADRQAAEVVATVEKTLRGAARSADRVTGDGNGRFRVVLPATGELAARAYLRRVRATVGPSLDAVDVPLGLVTATATVLDDTVHIAVAQAEARLDAALASAARRASDDEPRAKPN